MIAVLLLILLVVWAAVLIPPWVRARAEHSPQTSIAGFNRRLSVLAMRARDTRPLPGFAATFPTLPPPAAPGFVGLQPGLTQSEAQRRRAMIVQGLAGAAACTFVLGLLPPLRFFLVLFVLDLIALAGYIALLLQWKNNRVERRVKVRPLPMRSVPNGRPAMPAQWYPQLERQAR